ncbi:MULTISPECIES: hypothetical protein [Lysobacteraceae]|nr:MULTISPECIES: hypothetical protein [Lysobacter]
MKRPTQAFLLMTAMLAVASDVFARDDDALVEMFHEIAGPATKTWSLRLEPDGDVVEHRGDLSRRRERIRCRLSPVEADRVVASARQWLDPVPTRVRTSGPLQFDGPYKTLSVRQGADLRMSWWDAPAKTNLNADEQAFVRAWNAVEALLDCRGRK